jgi:hypothetical protein
VSGPPGAGRAREGGYASAGAGLLFCLAVSATFPAVLSGRPFYHGDFQAAFEPLRRVVGRLWHDGVPLWTGALSHGMPLLASPFVGVLYPPNLVFALAPAHAAQALSLLVVAHVLFGGWGAARLARRLGCGPPGSAAAALVFALSGATVSGTYMVVLVCTAMWVPWLVIAVLRARDGLPFGGATLGAVLGMTFLSGDPIMILAGVLGGVCIASGSSISRRAATSLAGGLALGILLASPTLLALRRYLPATVRAAGLPAGLRVSRSLHPLEMVGAVVPDAFGSRVLAGPEGILYPGQADGNGLPLFPGLYAGACALSLAAVGSVRAPFRRRLLVWLALLALLALGRYGPLAFASGLPGLVTFRYPSKWILAAALPLSLLAGSGVSALEGADAARSRRVLSGVLACALIGLAALGAAANLGLARALAAACSAGGGSPVPAVLQALRSHLLEGVARGALPAAAALGICRLASVSRAAPWLISLVLALDLVSANASLAPTAPARFYEERPAAVRAIEGDPAGHARVWVDQSAAARSVQSRTPAGADQGGVDAALFRRRERLDAYAAASYGLSLAFQVDLEALGTSRYALLTSAVYAAPRRAQVTLLGAAGVSHLVTPMEIPDGRVEEIARLDVGADQPLHVYRNRAVLPRARLVKVLVPTRAENVAALLARVDDGFFANQTLVAESDLPAIAGASRAAGASASPGDVRLVEDAGRRVVVRSSGGGGFLVLADSFAPGWRASVDGRETPVFPADVAFRMVVVPPGTHDIVFEYSPWRP